MKKAVLKNLDGIHVVMLYKLYKTVRIYLNGSYLLNDLYFLPYILKQCDDSRFCAELLLDGCF